MVYGQRALHILKPDIENTVVNTTNERYAWRMMGRLGVIPSVYNGFPVF